MATKGPSNRYGTPRGQFGKDNPNGVNFAWAKSFNNKSLSTHFKKHGQEFGLDSEESYGQHAVRFANTVDTKNNKAYVDKKGTTYKYNKKTNELVIVDKKGIIVSYYIVEKGFHYQSKREGKKWIPVKKK